MNMKQVYYNSAEKTVNVEFTGMPELEEFKKQANSIIEKMKEFNSIKVLNDISKLDANSIENQEWTENIWFPEAEKTGLKYYAFIMAENIFGQVSAEQTNEKAEEKSVIKIKYFGNRKDAEKWLSEK